MTGARPVETYFGSNRRVSVGDRIRYAGMLGRVILIIEEDAALPEYRESMQSWKFSHDNGVILKLDNGLLFRLFDTSEEEDLEIVEDERR